KTDVVKGSPQGTAVCSRNRPVTDHPTLVFLQAPLAACPSRCPEKRRRGPPPFSERSPARVETLPPPRRRVPPGRQDPHPRRPARHEGPPRRRTPEVPQPEGVRPRPRPEAPRAAVRDQETRPPHAQQAGRGRRAGQRRPGRSLRRAQGPAAGRTPRRLPPAH